MEPNESSLLQGCRRLQRLCAVLRGPGGCAWDRAQTGESLAPYLLEEVHEVFEALSYGDKDRLADEIGDALYLWVLFLDSLETSHAVRIEDCVRRIEEKLSRRHPEVFGSEGAAHGGDRESWEQLKRRELAPGADHLNSLPAGLPALARARRLQEKAAAYGFDWGHASEVVEKIHEEIGELMREVDSDRASHAVEEELGDLLFAVVNLARHLEKDPEAVLLAATEKFRTRFNIMARALEAAGHRLGEAPLEVMETYWKEAKRAPPPRSRRPAASGSESSGDLPSGR